jgi:hypothetical protein
MEYAEENKQKLLGASLGNQNRKDCGGLKVGPKRLDISP